MGFGGAVSSGFNKYVTFSGRAARSEYWWWFVFLVLLGLAFGVVAVFVLLATKSVLAMRLVQGVMELGLFLPTLALAVRRLHDLDRSGWWYGASFIIWIFLTALGVIVALRIHQNHVAGYPPTDGIPSAVYLVMGVLGLAELVLCLMLFIWFCMRGTRGSNRFGGDPLRDF